MPLLTYPYQGMRLEFDEADMKAMLTMNGVKYNAQHLSTLLVHMCGTKHPPCLLDFEAVQKAGQTFYRLKP